MTYKYFKVVDTTKSDLIKQKPLTKEEIEYRKELVEFYTREIHDMLENIEWYRVQNYYIAHELSKNNITIEME